MSIQQINQTFYPSSYFEVTTQKDSLGRFPLHLAATNGDLEALKKALKEKTYCINSKDAYGETALVTAAYYGHESLVEELLKQDKINIHVENSQGGSALSYAMKKRYFLIGALLIAKNADIRSVSTNDLLDTLEFIHSSNTHYSGIDKDVIVEKISSEIIDHFFDKAGADDDEGKALRVLNHIQAYSKISFKALPKARCGRVCIDYFKKSMLCLPERLSASPIQGGLINFFEKGEILSLFSDKDIMEISASLKSEKSGISDEYVELKEAFNKRVDALCIANCEQNSSVKNRS